MRRLCYLSEAKSIRICKNSFDGYIDLSISFLRRIQNLLVRLEFRVVSRDAGIDGVIRYLLDSSKGLIAFIR